jgi:hypothetical protein
MLSIGKEARRASFVARIYKLYNYGSLCKIAPELFFKKTQALFKAKVEPLQLTRVI